MQDIPSDYYATAISRTFDNGVAELLIKGLTTGYESACELHAPELGGNETTFGVGVYEYTKFELMKIARKHPELVVMKSQYPVFRLAVGQFLIANHRVGHYAQDDIHRCFPNTDRAARVGHRRNVHDSRQLSLLPKELEPMYCTSNLVLAHLGNPNDGLCAVYLCRPGHVEGERIASWSFVYPLWARDGMSAPKNEDVAALPGDEIIPEPIVVRKARPTLANEA